MNKQCRRFCFLTTILVALLPPAPAQEVVVSTFDTGRISWTNPPAWNMYEVQWSPDLAAGAWWNNWSNQSVIITRDAGVSVPVPMAYRVSRGFNERALDGPWIVYHEGEPSIVKFDGKGLITMFGAFTDGNPAGHYNVAPNGTYAATVYDSEEVIRFSGSFIHEQTINYVYLNITGLIHKVMHPDALEGTWRGSIGPYTNVVIQVRPDGFAPGISNLIDVATGSFYVDNSNRVAGAIFTGAGPEDDWNCLAIYATRITTTNIFGDYELDTEFGYFTAGVNLTRIAP